MFILVEKAYNVLGITIEMAQCGEAVWINFNAPKEKQEWYYRNIIEEVEIYHPIAVLLKLEQVVDELLIRVEK